MSSFGLAFKSTSWYERRPAIMKLALSWTIGPSNITLEESSPKPTVPPYSLVLPSFWRTSNTEERRPPKGAGIPPLYNFKSRTASPLNTEKNPKMCEELYTGASSSKMRFWSVLPPRTLNPEAPSPTVVTPGSSVIERITSNSPKNWGMVFICLAVNCVVDISARFKFSSSFLAVTWTSCNSLVASFSSKFTVWLSFKLTFLVIVS